MCVGLLPTKLNSERTNLPPISLKKSKPKMEEIIAIIDYRFKILEAYIRTIESQKYDEFSIPILKNYQAVLSQQYFTKYGGILLCAPLPPTDDVAPVQDLEASIATVLLLVSVSPDPYFEVALEFT